MEAHVTPLPSLHCRHSSDLLKSEVDKVASNTYLKYRNISGYRGLMIIIQNQIFNELDFRKYILKDLLLQIRVCRKFSSDKETILRITLG
jgi:hypothetical protein